MIHRVLYDWLGWNLRLFDLINGFHHPVWDHLMRDLSFVGDHRHFLSYMAFVCLTGILLISQGLHDGRGEALAFRWFTVVSVLVLGYGIDHVLVGALKEYVDYPRPATLGLGQWLLITTARTTSSFPSGHAAFVSLFAVSLWPASSVFVRFLLALFVLAVCVSRVSLGAHFPADVVGGALLGWLVARVLRASLWAVWRAALPTGSELP